MGPRHIGLRHPDSDRRKHIEAITEAKLHPNNHDLKQKAQMYSIYFLENLKSRRDEESTT